MVKARQKSEFTATLQRPAKPGKGAPWAFIVLPRTVSETLPRRGRTTVEGSINRHPFRATLDPDGHLSHWLKVNRKRYEAAGAAVGATATVEIQPVAREPEPRVPRDLRAMLAESPAAMATWQATTTIARVDWVHWVTSAKQAATRARRVRNAGDMLASGKRRVCCFDPSGYYDKSLGAPEAAD